jgi:hypothetical protein
LPADAACATLHWLPQATAHWSNWQWLYGSNYGGKPDGSVCHIASCRAGIAIPELARHRSLDPFVAALLLPCMSEDADHARQAKDAAREFGRKT